MAHTEPRLGQTFVPRVEGAHLFIIMSDPDDDPDHVALVRVSTYRGGAGLHDDDSCLLEPGDHPSVDHTSFVFYGDLIEANLAQTRTLISNSSTRQDLAPAVLERVQEGALQSPETPLWCKDLLRRQQQKPADGSGE